MDCSENVPRRSLLRPPEAERVEERLRLSLAATLRRQADAVLKGLRYSEKETPRLEWNTYGFK